MEKKYIEANNRINKLLRDGLIVALSMEENGRKDLADWIMATTSKIAYEDIKASKLQEALTKFWKEKKALSQNIN